MGDPMPRGRRFCQKAKPNPDKEMARAGGGGGVGVTKVKVTPWLEGGVEIEDATIFIVDVRDGVAEIVKESADISHSLEILEVRLIFLFFVWRSDVFQYKIGR